MEEMHEADDKENKQCKNISIVLHCRLPEFAPVIEETATLKSNLTASSLRYIMTEVTFKQCNADRNNNDKR